MKLPMTVEGYIEDSAAKIFSWDKLQTFAKRIGVDTTAIDIHKQTKRSFANFILTNAPKDNAELVISSFVIMSKAGTYDGDFSAKIIEELNPILKSSMNCKVDETGKLSPLFAHLKQEPSLIAMKLTQLGFTQASTFYEQASDAFNVSPKGSVSLLRSTIDSLTEEIITAKGLKPLPTFKDRLTQITQIGLLKIIDITECKNCHHRKNDNEFNLSYDLYGILSHYGSHTGLVDDQVASFLFTTTSAFVWLLLERL